MSGALTQSRINNRAAVWLARSLFPATVAFRYLEGEQSTVDALAALTVGSALRDIKLLSQKSISVRSAMEVGDEVPNKAGHDIIVLKEGASKRFDHRFETMRRCRR
jgi:hypothetical protein